MIRLRYVRLVLALLVAALVTVTACSAGNADPEPAEQASDSPEVYVAVGADETLGVGAERPLVEAWPQLLFRSLDRGATFVSAGTEGSTVAEAIREQLPIVRELQPTLVTVWFNVNDLLAGVTPATYEQELGDLVHTLRQDARTRVLVANTPPLEAFPAVQEDGLASAVTSEALPGLIDAYNRAVDAVAAREGAEVVDLHGALAEAVADGTFPSLVGEDGAHPSTAGHAEIAEVFKAALAS